MLDEQMFNKWKEFFESLTTEWLAENYVGKYHTSDIDRGHSPTGIATFYGVFRVHCAGTRFRFKTSGDMRTLLRSVDEELIAYFPPDVWEDFMRLTNL